MKTTLLTATAFSLASTFALAQQQPPPPPVTPPSMDPPATMPSPRTAVPVPGENSFTEEQARERLTEAGYSDVGMLTLDANGVWRGTATKNGAAVNVGLDFKGNIVEQ